MADTITDLLPAFVTQRTPRFGAYDPEADLINAYGQQPLLPSFVDPTLGGYSQRNPGFSIAAQNPGVPVILPMDIPTNPHRELKGVRYERDYGDLATDFESRSPMVGIPVEALSSGSRGLDPTVMGAAIGGMTPVKQPMSDLDQALIAREQMNRGISVPYPNPKRPIEARENRATGVYEPVIDAEYYEPIPYPPVYKRAPFIGSRGGYYSGDDMEIMDATIDQLRAASQNQPLGGELPLPGNILGSLLGGTIGQAYSETLGEGDTMYYDPSGEERLKAREAYLRSKYVPDIYFDL